MADLLLQTKCRLPLIRDRLVARARLLDRLAAGLWQEGASLRKVTLVSAPAGYGKTTLIAQWLRRLGCGVGWLSLDEADNSPTRFLADLLGTMQSVQPGFGETTQAMLHSPQPPPLQATVTALVGELSAIRVPFVLALDDYHVIHTPSIHQQLTFLLEHQPPQMHLVLMTREDPQLPIPRLRVSGQVMEIRQGDLRFDLHETEEFLGRVMGLTLGADEIGTLEKRTEGWIAGLQLAALSMQGRHDPQEFVRNFAGSNRFVLDYLIDEVFQRQTAEVQDFLLKTSVPDRLSGPLCDAIVDRADSQRTLEHLEQSNLFIVPLDLTRTWYRYHRLFSELLRQRLRSSGMYDIALLHQKASRWFEVEGYLSDAVEHALAAQDWGQAARLIGQASDGMLKRGEIITLIGWCGKLPDEITQSQPPLAIANAWALLLAAQFGPAEAILDQAERSVEHEPLLLGGVAAAQAYQARAKGDNPRLIEKSEQALSLLPETDLAARCIVALNLGLAYWHTGRLEDAERVLREAQEASRRSGNHYALLSAQVFLARTLGSRGKLRQAAAMYQNLIQAAGNAPVLALAHYDLCTTHYEWNDLQRAKDHLHHGMEISAHSGNVEFQNAGHILGAFLSLAEGDAAGGLAAIEQSDALTREFPVSARARSAACHVRVALALGDLESARNWGEHLSDDADGHSFYRFLGLARPLLLIALGKKDAAAEELEASYATASQAGWGYAVVAVRVMQSLAASTPESGVAFLSEALRLGQPEGFVRTFADAGEPLIPLLREAARRGIHPQYAGQILAAVGGDRRNAAPEQAQLVEPLSEREIEVLRLVAAGLSNREIAKELVISLGTAKTHVHNLCGKLGVRNRTEAAMRAKELNLV